MRPVSVPTHKSRLLWHQARVVVLREESKPNLLLGPLSAVWVDAHEAVLDETRNNTGLDVVIIRQSLQRQVVAPCCWLRHPVQILRETLCNGEAGILFGMRAKLVYGSRTNLQVQLLIPKQLIGNSSELASAIALDVPGTQAIVRQRPSQPGLRRCHLLMQRQRQQRGPGAGSLQPLCLSPPKLRDEPGNLAPRLQGFSLLEVHHSIRAISPCFGLQRCSHRRVCINTRLETSRRWRLAAT
mmetsp:Transcript_6708/g.16781  ORF Transcript_6708/g.16781 Transcript_6708/m.16781 type:complete len:241 (-) Transcript_6708:99-821(-)